MNKFILTAAATVLAGASAFAHEEHKAGDLVIDHPVARATPANAPVSGGYMTIRNTGEEADRLMAVAAFHAAAALGHHYLWHDAVLRRILPGRASSAPYERS